MDTSHQPNLTLRVEHNAIQHSTLAWLWATFDLLATGARFPLHDSDHLPALIRHRVVRSGSRVEPVDTVRLLSRKYNPSFHSLTGQADSYVPACSSLG